MKKFLTISGLVVLGLVLRLICINKAEGLWNDEYVSWMIASTPFNEGFWNAVKSQCHMPLYYFYLKFVMSVFGQSDLVLRLSSVFCGLISIPVMYFTGKEDSEKTGFLCAGFSAISSFLIYYSQEVRLYSLLFLISAACLLFTIKLIKEPNKKNLILTSLFSFLIMLTHTIGFVFVFFNLVFISVNLFKKYKKVLLYIWSSLLFLLLALSPLIINIFSTRAFSQWWGHFTISKTAYLFTDYFSPILTNLTNAPDKFLFTPIMLITAIIAICMIIKAIIRNKINLELFLIAILTSIILVIASIMGKLVFITKYSIEIYPVLIYLFCFGVASINNKILRNSLIVVYSILSLGYILLSPISAPKLIRYEGHKLVADSLKKMNLNKGDYILIEYYQPKRFEKYFDFADYNVVFVDKGNFPQYLLPDTTYEQTYSNGKELFRGMFLKGHNEYYENKLNQEIFSKMKAGQNLATVTLNSVAIYDPMLIQKIAGHAYGYEKTPLLFMIFSYLKYENFYDIIKVLDFRGSERHGSWTINKFTKLNK